MRVIFVTSKMLNWFVKCTFKRGNWRSVFLFSENLYTKCAVLKVHRRLFSKLSRSCLCVSALVQSSNNWTMYVSFMLSRWSRKTTSFSNKFPKTTFPRAFAISKCHRRQGIRVSYEHQSRPPDDTSLGRYNAGEKKRTWERVSRKQSLGFNEARTTTLKSQLIKEGARKWRSRGLRAGTYLPMLRHFKTNVPGLPSITQPAFVHAFTCHPTPNGF